MYGGSEVLKIGQYVYHPLNNFEKCFLLHVKSSFRFRVTQIFEFLTSPHIPRSVIALQDDCK